jgi:anaerobic magnesium-protoporphyrin IX monomethyl ester cyclase
MIDVLLINPGNSNKVYQDLSNKYTAIEPPTWSLLLAKSCQSQGFVPKILDCNAENLSNNEILKKVEEANPRLICFVVYGQNVNAGTTSMEGAINISNFLKEHSNRLIGYVGSHVQALPLETLKKEKSIDFVFTNEGVYALWNILKLSNISIDNLKDIKGIAYRNQNGKVIFNRPEIVVPNNKMDEHLPGYAWELLPFKNEPFDLYRSPMWHAEYSEENRTPYAAIQTSLGCQFKCSFCMINIINRNDNKEIGVANTYSNMRYWSPNFIIKEFDKLISYGVKTIKITDEMFLLNPKYYKPLCEMLAERNKDDKLMMWAYSRVDTVKRKEILSLVRKAGIKWLALGIESGDKNVRLEVSKGKFEDVDVNKVIEQVHDSDIQVMGNYIFGLPGDTKESMKKTLDLSIKLNTLGWNGYAATALPGSELYKIALDKGEKLPETYEAYSFHSYNALPLSNENLTAAEILHFRDEAFLTYHKNENFLKKALKKFGKKSVDNIKAMTSIKLKRQILEKN